MSQTDDAYDVSIQYIKDYHQQDKMSNLFRRRGELSLFRFLLFAALLLCPFLCPNFPSYVCFTVCVLSAPIPFFCSFVCICIWSGLIVGAAKEPFWSWPLIRNNYIWIRSGLWPWTSSHQLLYCDNIILLGVTLMFLWMDQIWFVHCNALIIYNK